MDNNKAEKKKVFFKDNIFLLRKIILGALAVLQIALILFGLPGPLYGITLKELGNAIASLDSEQEKLLEDIVASETIVETRKNEISALNEDLRMLGIQISELDRQKEELLKSIEEKKMLLSDRAVFTYKYGNNDVARFIISAKDLNEVVNNLFPF